MPKARTIVVTRRPLGTSVVPLGKPAARTFPHARTVRFWPTMAVVSMTLAALAASAIWLCVRPTYEVAATLHIEPSEGVGLPGVVESAAHYQRYLATEVMKLRSETLLDATMETPEIQSLGLWNGVDDPRRFAHRGLHIAPVAGTQLIKVAMTGDRPEDLANIINTLLRIHLERHEQRQCEHKQEIVQSLTAEQAELQAALRSNLAAREQSITVQGADGSTSLATIETRAAELRNELSGLQQARALATARLDTLQNARADGGPLGGDPKELEEFLGKDIELQALNEKYGAAETKIIEDQKDGRLPTHPEVRGRLKEMAALRRRITAREKELREPYIATTARKIQAELDDATVASAVLERELDAIARERAGAIKMTRHVNELDAESERLEQELSRIKQKIRDVSVEENRRSYVTLQAAARVPAAPNLDHRPILTGFAVLVSLFVGGSVALIRRTRRRGFDHPGEVARRLGLNVVGSVQATCGDGLALQAVDQRLVEPVTGIASTEMTTAQPHTRSRMITSATERCGQSSFAENLARSMASRGRRVLLIDADAGCHGITDAIGMTGRPGLMELLSGDASPDDVVCGLASAPAGGLTNDGVSGGEALLTVIPIGTGVGGLAERLNDWHAQVKFRSMFEGYDEVVVSGPPVLAVGDAVLLASLVDEVILVVQPGRSAERQATQARQFLESVGVHVTGVVLSHTD